MIFPGGYTTPRRMDALPDGRQTDAPPDGRRADAPKDGRTCERCRRTFRDPSTLKRHQQNKRPCAPVVDTPGEAAVACHYCGRSYSKDWNLRRHLRICPIAARGERGIDDLYAHVQERTRRANEREEAAAQEVEDLRAELAKTRQELASHRNEGGLRIDSASVVNVTDSRVYNVTVNVFGREDTRHITTASVRDILFRCGGAVAEGGAAALDPAGPMAQALLQMALMIYSDPDRPENITCFVPNKRDGNVLIHGSQGWEIVPVPLVLPPMARSSLDLLFEKQPLEGDEEDLGRCGAALQALRKNEERLVSEGANLRTILVRNMDLLSRVLSQLPVAGTSSRKVN